MTNVITGAASWFSGQTTATGVPASTTAGIAVLNDSTKGGYYLVKAPNGDIAIAKQIDYGPSATATSGPFAGQRRIVDLTPPLLSMFGYTQHNFPTDTKPFSIYYLGKNLSTLGPKLGTGLTALHATPSQGATLIQSLDSGALAQGHTAVVAPIGQAAGTTIKSAGQHHSASEAVSAGINLNPLSGVAGAIAGVFNQAVADLKYGAVLLVAIIAGAYLLTKGLTGKSPAEHAQNIAARVGTVPE